MAYNIAGDLDVPGQKKKPDGLQPGDPGYDPSAGPPALVPAPAPTAVRTPTLTFNPPASQLQNEGALRPETGPFSPSNLQPMTDGAGNLITRPTPGAAPSIASAPAPALAAPASRSPDVPTIASIALPSFNGIRSGAATAVGPRVFSDGSGGPNAPAATMTRPQIDDLANGSRLSRADPGIGGGIVSAAGGGTQPVGAGAGVFRPQLPVDPVAAAAAANARAQRDAQSDLASIATRDSRSVLGNAARTAAIDAGSSFGTPASRRTAYADSIGALNAAATAGLKPAADLGIAGVTDAGATARDTANNATEYQKAVLTRPTPPTQVLEDGTLGVVGPDGNVRQSRGPDGKPVRPQIGKPQEDIASLNKTVEERVKTLLGINPLTGLIEPADGKGKGRAPTAAEYAQADAAARAGIGRQGQPAAAQAPIEGAVHVDAQGNRARLVNGQWVPVA